MKQLEAVGVIIRRCHGSQPASRPARCSQRMKAMMSGLSFFHTRSRGSGTVETRNAMGQMVVDNLAAFFAGKPLISPV